MKLIMSNDNIRITRTFLKHKDHIHFQFYKLIEDDDLYKKLKHRNIGTHYDNAVELKTSHNINKYGISEVIAMVDEVDNIIYIYGRKNSITQLFLATQPQSFVHYTSDLKQTPMLVHPSKVTPYTYIRHTFDYPLEDLEKMKSIIELDTQTKQYRLKKHVGETSLKTDIPYMIEDVIPYILDQESRNDARYDYAPYQVQLQSENTRAHNSRIVRQMAEVGNLRHLFMDKFPELTNVQNKTYDIFPQVEWEGDASRISIHQRNRTTHENNNYQETSIYGHYKDVQVLVESDTFYRYYDKSKEVQMSFKNLMNGLVVVKLYQFDIKDLGHKYLYFDLDAVSFQTNQNAIVFTNEEQPFINDLNQDMRKIIDVNCVHHDTVGQLSAKGKLQVDSFRQYLEQL